MKEEYDRLNEADRAYRNNIKNMPKGAPRIKRLRNKDYLYLARRKNDKVIYDYIGAAGSEKANKILKQVAQRRRYAKLLQGIRHDLRDVKKVLRGKI
ncbi:MAG: hypothetical protein JW863_12035 [Chitinispirillaceae bacterium]|nr:hypothetical protein [Chitinispirillaceae bacterium]